MQKFARRLSKVLAALFTAFTVLSTVPAQAAVVVPKVQYVEKPQLEYTAGDRVQFNLNAPNYGGRVQYRVVLWHNETKSYRDLWTTGDRYYTNWQPYGNNVFTLGWPISEPGTYRITIYTKRAGVPNNQTALKGQNCDSYMESEPFIVKPVAASNDAAAISAVEAYEAAPLATLEQVTAAEALKAAAETAVAAVTDAAKKAELTSRIAAQDVKVAAAKALVGFVNVQSAAATNVNTIKVVFDQEVGALTKENFNIYEKDNDGAVLFVNKVVVDKNVATITLEENLETEVDYSIAISNVKSIDGKLALKEAVTKDFQFVEADAASIEFKNVSNNEVKVLQGKSVDFIVKDANGNDITNNFEVYDPDNADGEEPVDGQIVVETSNIDIVSPLLVASSDEVGFAVVRAYVYGTEISTANTIVRVAAEAAVKLTSLGALTIGADVDFDEPINYVYKSATEDFTINVQAKDQMGEEINDENPVDGTIEYSYRVINPSVLVVNDGAIVPVTVGKTTIVVTAVQSHDEDGKTVVDAKLTKSYEVEVKADPEAKSLKLGSSSVKLVTSDVDIEKVNVANVDVDILDQYGKDYSNEEYDVTVEAEKEGIATVEYADGIITVTALEDAIPAGKTSATVNVKVAYGNEEKTLLTGTIAVTVYKPGEVIGYVVEANGSTGTAVTLDINPDRESKNLLGEEELTVVVYLKDANGRYVGVADEAFIVGEKNKAALDIDETNDTGLVATAAEVGTEKVTVKLGTVTLATITATVKNSAPVFTKVEQKKTSITVNNAEVASLDEIIFGAFEDGKITNKADAVFIAYDQYNNEIEVAMGADADYVVYSTNTGVVDSDLSVVSAGKATLIVVVKDATYRVDVLVK